MAINPKVTQLKIAKSTMFINNWGQSKIKLETRHKWPIGDPIFYGIPILPATHFLSSSEGIRSCNLSFFGCWIFNSQQEFLSIFICIPTPIFIYLSQLNSNLAGHPFLIVASYGGVERKPRLPGFTIVGMPAFSILTVLLFMQCPYSVLFASRVLACCIRSSLSIRCEFELRNPINDL